jgi:hypothetical protein
MPVYTSTSFRIKVMIVGRKDPIQSHTYSTREAAEADLVRITEARHGRSEVDLPWLQMPGDQVQVAYIDEHSVSMGSI